MHPEYALGILLEFEPRAAGRDNGGIENLLTGLVHLHAVVNARRSHELGNDNAFRTVDKRSVVGHKRKVAHKHVLIDNVVGDLVYEPDFNAERARERSVPVPALLLVVLGLSVKIVVEKVQFEVIGIVGYRRKIFENFAYPLANESVVRIFLNFDQIREFDRFFDLTERFSRDLAAFYFG